MAQQITEKNFFAKVVVVVDDDLDVTNQEQMLAALGARWQPAGATRIYESLPALPLDPSLVKRARGSKIAIDATRQLAGRGRSEGVRADEQDVTRRRCTRCDSDRRSKVGRDDPQLAARLIDPVADSSPRQRRMTMALGHQIKNNALRWPTYCRVSGG